MTLHQTQTVENRESDPKQVVLTPFVTVTHLKGLYIPCDPPDNQNNASSHSSAVSRNPVGLDSSPPLDPSPLMAEHSSSTSRKTHHCRECGEKFALKADLQRHMTLYKKRLRECSFCRKRCTSTCKLKAHIRLCHSGRPCTCPVCAKTFKLKGYLSKHMRIHTGVGEKPFSCGDCGKSFNLKGNLKNHMLTHTGEKSFSCADCGKSFNQKGSLKKHKLTHTGKTPFSCGDCGKSFNQKWKLSLHIQTHTVGKPFSCADCGKSFNQKGSLKKHTLTHTGEKPFSCDDCGKSFIQKGNLRSHKLTHTGEKPFSCDDCGKSFTQKSNLLTHVKNIHKGGKQD
ncbi:gastrula zinc finger protein XlCGF8.2DB-like [Oncorhynchus tshawytscha]|uniref:gastrula zinc finger protein XlCGF8.2DB-like n=1 Tax=Oncorhynchus tshawytscha TaxID=74940 RepID=UPI001C3E784B|nr:gastrula zinc finger protein XlCGF8.2DB-like [Oncorhynchus tshawytscha]